MASGDQPLAQSINVQPQWEWTLEAWVKPVGSQQQQVISFHNDTVEVPPTAPTMDYAVGLKGQQVFSFNCYIKGDQIDSSYLLTSISPAASFYPKREFTWECWIQPDETPAPAPGTGPVPIGVIFQIGGNLTNPSFAVGLSSDRLLYIQTLDRMNQVINYITTLAIPAEDANDNPIWSHIALIGDINSPNTDWTIKVVLNGNILQTFNPVVFTTIGNPRLIIGGNTLNNTSMFGKISQLRYWGFARTLSEIRRTWLTSLTGSEYGLLGSWPMGELKTNAKSEQYFENTAYITGQLRNPMP